MSALALAYEDDEQRARVAEEMRIVRERTETIRAEMAEKRFPITRRDALLKGKRLAREAHNIAADEYMPERRRESLAELCTANGVDYPESKFGQHCEVARLTDAGWFGRQLRKADWRQYEAQQLRLGTVRHYCSDAIARARTWHRAALQKLLESLFIMNEQEQIFALSDMWASSTANPVNRFSEIVVRGKGMARYAHSKGLRTFSMITLTAPSKYHRLKTAGGKWVVQNGKPRRIGGTLIPNADWNGSTPRETNTYLGKVWARIRSALHRIGIPWLAFRTVEPHMDGTPHWHITFYCEPEMLEACKLLISVYGMEEDAGEPGAAEHRVTFNDYIPKPGASAEDMEAMADRAIAYLIAYLAKNITGSTGKTGEAEGRALDTSEGQTYDAGDAAESCARVEAWATTWGIRQFAELGTGKKVTCWRELRRLRDPIDDAAIEPARAAADGSRYEKFLDAAQQMELWAEDTQDRMCLADRRAAIEADGEFSLIATEEMASFAIDNKLLNRWGEPSRRWIMGVRVTVPVYVWPSLLQRVHVRTETRTRSTREHTWQIIDSVEIERRALAACVSSYHDMIGPLVVNQHANGRPVTKFDAAKIAERALAVAPGFFFSRAAPPRALDLCQ